MEQITAKISGVQFQNRQTGFYILRVILDGARQSVVRGTFPGVSISSGLKVKFTGGYETHEKYGKQFSATGCEVILEKGRNGIVTYLMSNVPSVGMITATKLYEALGDELVNVLNDDPNQIRQLPFLTKTQSDAIKNGLMLLRTGP